jgi:phenylacetate-coenzyme A ligase PaaK-like adenylate-forming protein
MGHTTASAADLSGQLIARTRWTAERLAAHQRDRLDSLLRHAVANSPYYRRVLGQDAACGQVPLRELPVLTKAALMGHFDEIVTDGRLRRGQVEAHLAGPSAGELLGGFRVFSTAGSTGRRGVFAYSAAEFAVWMAAQVRMLHTMGVTASMRVAAVGAPDPVHLSRQVFAALAAGRPAAVTAGRPAVPDLSVTTPLPELVSALNAYQPDAVPTYASTAAMLAEEQLAGRLRIAPAIVATGAEVLTGDMRQRIVEAWGVEPHQAYLATEAPLLASTCARQVGLHLWEDLTLVEVVDDRNQPAEPGVPGHKVLITNLVNRTQPLIRYELSDSVTLAADPDPTGMPFRRLAAVDGRSDDAIALPAADGTTVTVHPLRLRAPFGAFPDVIQYQIGYDGTALTVRLVLRGGSSPGLPGQIQAALTRALRQAGAVPPPITTVRVPVIDREPGHAGKYKLVK